MIVEKSEELTSYGIAISIQHWFPVLRVESGIRELKEKDRFKPISLQGGAFESLKTKFGSGVKSHETTMQLRCQGHLLSALDRSHAAETFKGQSQDRRRKLRPPGRWTEDARFSVLCGCTEWGLIPGRIAHFNLGKTKVGYTTQLSQIVTRSLHMKSTPNPQIPHYPQEERNVRHVYSR
jgi:hypothetical protein